MDVKESSALLRSVASRIDAIGGVVVDGASIDGPGLAKPMKSVANDLWSATNGLPSVDAHAADAALALRNDSRRLLSSASRMGKFQVPTTLGENWSGTYSDIAERSRALADRLDAGIVGDPAPMADSRALARHLTDVAFNLETRAFAMPTGASNGTWKRLVSWSEAAEADLTRATVQLETLGPSGELVAERLGDNVRLLAGHRGVAVEYGSGTATVGAGWSTVYADAGKEVRAAVRLLERPAPSDAAAGVAELASAAEGASGAAAASEPVAPKLAQVVQDQLAREALGDAGQTADAQAEAARLYRETGEVPETATDELVLRLGALLRDDPHALDDHAVDQVVATVEPAQKSRVRKVLQDLRAKLLRKGKADGTAATGAMGPMLSKYGVDLTEAARNGELRGAIGRDAVLTRITNILAQPTKNNPLIVGPAGAGKTAIFEELAKLIASGNAPEHLRDKQVVKIDLDAMVAGTNLRGMFEERLKGVVQEIVDSKGKIIPVIDEVHKLQNAGAASNTEGAGEALKEPLARGLMHMVGASTHDDMAAFRADAALARRFTEVEIDGLDRQSTIDVLTSIAPRVQEDNRISIDESALADIVDLSSRHILDRAQPDPAVSVFDEAVQTLVSRRDAPPQALVDLDARYARLESRRALLGGQANASDTVRSLDEQLDAVASQRDKLRNGWNEARSLRDGKPPKGADADALRASFPDVFADRLTPSLVNETIARIAKVPIGSVSGDELRKLGSLESDLGQRVVGQPEAVSAIASAVRRGRLGVRDPNLPRLTVLEVGDPGSGKTQMAKSLAELLFGSKDAMIRADMGTVATTGGDPIGRIFEGLQRRPHSVVLVDEVEKATPAFMDGLLTALGEGYIERNGKHVSTRDAVFVLTSNLPPEQVPHFFRREFLDRVDEVAHFNRVGGSELQTLVGRELDSVASRVSDWKVELGQPVRDAMAAQVEASGVRDMKRTIERQVGGAIEDAVFRQQAPHGSRIVLGVAPDGAITADVAPG